jgi:putative transposase
MSLLRAARSRDRILSVLEETRQRYRFAVVGYVVMPEHIYLLLSEPEVGTPSTVMQVLKQRTARALLPKVKPRDPRQSELFGEISESAPFWQTRFHDFNVWTEKKRVEKLRYMHRNPVKRGLVAAPEDWRWSSYRFYLLDEPGPVRVNEGWGRFRFGHTRRERQRPMVRTVCRPPFAKTREGWGTHFVDCASGRLGHPPITESFPKPDNLCKDPRHCRPQKRFLQQMKRSCGEVSPRSNAQTAALPF